MPKPNNSDPSKICARCGVLFLGSFKSTRCRPCQEQHTKEAKAERWRCNRGVYIENKNNINPETTRERIALERMAERQAREIDVEDKPGKPYRAPSLAAADAITGVRNVAVNREHCLTGGAAQTCNAHSQGLRVE